MEWTRGRTVGHGSTAAVSLATLAESGEVFAVKSAELGASASLQREQRILSSLSSPRIVEYRGFDVTREGNNKLMYNLFMEFVPGGTLADLSRKLGGRLSQPTIARYTRQILEGLEHLHSRGIAHCDVKGSNILIGEDGPKLADFGCARRVDDPAAAEAPFGGTPMYMSPEVARGEEQGHACDVWALGCTVVETATGGAPWSGGDPASVLYRIAYSVESPEIPGWLSEEAMDFLGKCLRRDPRERWTPRQLLEHPFLIGGFKSGLDIGDVKQNREWESSASSTSPTSVLDGGLYWSSAEEESETGAADEDGKHKGDAAGDRIRRLSASSAGPTWAREDWIDVRGCVVDDDVGDEGSGDSIGWSEVEAVGGKVGGEELNGATSRDALEAWDCGEIGFVIRNSDHILLRPLMT
ncbi:mitogen-activated protein kinase kinase kinase 18-like [Rhodamnia argentea]|uniref:Mitogen-activated protein kinase kinase kinase 18-like n=1 Tax=Rhodamnia argentea TaxID=178133 RepID=A0A8B8PY31_9MYRT|nr:mitogen-activated protein kinase kinase kinase 18-like [Rhodamnia argentea]